MMKRKYNQLKEKVATSGIKLKMYHLDIINEDKKRNKDYSE